MAARMPACYAAVYKVLEEVSMRLPTFTPQSMLDFGAGPGTAIWAAHEVGFMYTKPTCLVFLKACRMGKGLIGVNCWYHIVSRTSFMEALHAVLLYCVGS